MAAPQLTAYAQGQGVVDGDQLNTFEQTCSNAVQLRALVGVPGMQVFMRGYVTPGDGGAGPFYWNATANGPDDGGVTTIVPQSGVVGAWLRLYPAITIGADGVTWTSGIGSPSSVQPRGSLYSNTTGGVGSTLYVSQGGGTWNAVAGV